ncbi:MAG TPA: hypothetical protein VGK58_09150 [Lacipirellulaceae bacterium]
MSYTIRRQIIPGAPIQFSCPKCRKVSQGKACQFVDTFMLLYFLPLGAVRNTYVACDDCGLKLRTQLRLDDLERMQGLQIDVFLSYSPSFVFKFLTITALLLCLAPILGTIVAIIAVSGTYHFKGWPKKFSITALLISFVPTAIAIVGLLFGW